MKFLNDLTIMLFSRKIGEDQYGNKYYEDTKTYDGKRKKDMLDIMVWLKLQKYLQSGMLGFIKLKKNPKKN